MTKFYSTLTPVAVLVMGALSQPALAQDNQETSIERVSVLGSKVQIQKTAGSVSLIDESELGKYEYDDIARILASVPGVNVRGEDGYGLRPNIGFRGVTPERSKKINILEDGILIGPAPYSAPAAYYFPMTSRMTAVEVTKGPGAILYGPNTVAGTLNLVSRQVPDQAEGALDLALGTDGYGKAHLHYGNTQDNLGYLIEGLHVRADGFKQLDGGGDTGFAKSDVMAKLRYTHKAHLFELKLGYTDEDSDETYLGLTDDDFAKTPNRRYAASQLANMDWQHSQVQITHQWQSDEWQVTTRAYRNDFERAWFKLNGFGSNQGGLVPKLQEVLLSPELYQTYYEVLTGQRDSSLQEILILGNNQREYYSQGVQVDADWQVETGDLSHTLRLGVRAHQDEIRRDHTEDKYFMRSSVLVASGEAQRAGSTNTESSDVWSLYLHDSIEWGDVNLTLGVRGEMIDGNYQNRAVNRQDDRQQKSTTVWLPSISGYYQVTPQLGVFAGVHKGFVPTSPIQPESVDYERSVNYEIGTRYSDNTFKGELVGFFSDYKNLKESCSISAGCDTDQEFNGGEVDVYGIEASMSGDFALDGGWSMPWSVVYTHTQSEFQQSFVSAFEQWGIVSAGDPLPYLAENMLTLSLGVQGQDWQLFSTLRYADSMPETAQQTLALAGNAALTGVETDAYTLLDVAANYQLTQKALLYLKVDNLLDSADIASRRPYGARPTKPRQIMLGYKYQF